MGFLIILAFILVNYIKIREETQKEVKGCSIEKCERFQKKMQKKYWHFLKILKCKEIRKSSKWKFQRAHGCWEW